MLELNEKSKNSAISQNYYILLLISGVILVYYPVFTHDFLYLWDDQWQVITETTEGGFTWFNIKKIFSQPLSSQYFPVNQFIYLIIYTLAGEYNASAFHVVCLASHLINTLLIFILFKRMLQISKRVESDWINPISFITAILFAIHPLNVESVAWISASKIVFYATFYLLAIYYYISYTEKRNRFFYFLSLVLFVLAFGAKEQAVILPVCLLVIDWILKRDLRKKTIWLEKIPFFLLAFLLGLVTIYITYGKVSLGDENYPLWQRLIFGCYSTIEYLFKWLFPLNLLYLYPFPSRPGEALPEWLLLYPLLITIIILTLQNAIKQWPITIGLCLFIVNLIMTLHIIPMPRSAIVADRYIYISSTGLSFIVGYYFVSGYFKWAKYRVTMLIIGFIYILGLSIYSNHRARAWSDSDTLKKEVNELIQNKDQV